MAFQFLCPQGHLLQAEESQAGQQSQCPYCGSVFLIPQPTLPADPSTTPGNPPMEQPVEPPPSFQAPAPDAPPSVPSSPPPSFHAPEAGPPSFPPPEAAAPAFQTPEPPATGFQPPATEPQVEAGASDFPGIRTEPEPGRGGAAADVPTRFETPGAAELPIVHVICPNGHELETPREMLDQEALCPFCQAQFRLRLEDSAEYREEKAKERARQEMRAGQLWLRWAIAAAVVVVLGLILLIVFSFS
jgi:uncharacterized Zn-finger protein